MKLIICTGALLMAATLFSNDVVASGITYLTCTVRGDARTTDRPFDFTLDEASGTVSYFVKDANATNVERAVFGPETITWTDNSQYISSTSTINRIDLSYTQETEVVGNKNAYRGTCEVKTPAARKI